HFPKLQIESEVIDGVPVDAVVAESESARLTVVGTRGLGGFTGALLGSTSQGIAAHARGPVMIVPYAEDPRLEDRDEYGPMIDEDPVLQLPNIKHSGRLPNALSAPNIFVRYVVLASKGPENFPGLRTPRGICVSS